MGDEHAFLLLFLKEILSPAFGTEETIGKAFRGCVLKLDPVPPLLPTVEAELRPHVNSTASAESFLAKDFRLYPAGLALMVPPYPLLFVALAWPLLLGPLQEHQLISHIYQPVKAKVIPAQLTFLSIYMYLYLLGD